MAKICFCKKNNLFCKDIKSFPEVLTYNSISAFMDKHPNDINLFVKIYQKLLRLAKVVLRRGLTLK